MPFLGCLLPRRIFSLTFKIASTRMSELKEDDFTISAEKYLEKHHILTYLEDSIMQLLEHKEDNPKVIPVKFFCEYFCSLRDGNHTLFREFSFIKSTPHNRLSFVLLFWKCYRQLGKKGDLLSIQEYHSLLGLLCPDFPFNLVQNTARIVLIDNALDCLISFSDFMYAFQVQFYFEEFLDKAGRIYQDLLQTVHSPRDPVIVPTSGETGAKIHQNVHQPADGVDAMQFFRAIYPLLNRMEYSTPPLACLKEILFNVPRISFYQFLMAVAKSDSINTHLGRLPGRTELLEDTDNELTLVYQKVQGSNSQSRLSSDLRDIPVMVSVDTTASSKHSHRTQHSNYQLQKHRVILKSHSTDTDMETESDSESSSESSGTN